MSYCFNKTNELHQFLKFIFGIELYMFRTVPLSIIRSLALYTKQQIYVIQILLTTSYLNQHDSFRSRQQVVSSQQNCMKYTYFFVYSVRLLMMDRENIRNMWSSIRKINLRNQCISLVQLQEYITMHDARCTMHDARSSECQNVNVILREKDFIAYFYDT